MRNVGRAAAILIATTTFSYGIGEFGSARAQTKTKVSIPNSPLPTRWSHNGSIVSLVSEGGKQKIIYDTPRIGLLDAGVKPGTVLFEGKRKGPDFTGTAYQFYRTCKPHGYKVTGNTSDDGRHITLKGLVPLLDSNCNASGTRDDVLVFTATQSAPSDPPKDAQVASAPPAPAANITASTPAPTSEASKPAPSEATTPAPTETSKTAATASATPSAPPDASGVPETPPGEANKAVAVAIADAPIDTSKHKQATAAPPPESKTVPPREPAKDNQSAAPPTTNNEPAKQSVSNAASTPSANTPTDRTTAAPPSALPKETQLAALPDTAKSAAKDDKIKSDVANPNSSKTPAAADNKSASLAASAKIMEIVLKNGRILRIGTDVDPDALLRIIALLER